MAGNVVVNSIQLGNSNTATQNFVWITNLDGTCKLARGNNGATTQDIITVDTNGKVAFTQGAAGSIITSGTAQATTSGTSIDFTSIPSWVKRITVMLSGVSSNGTSIFLVQLGAGSVTTTGYLSQAWSGTTYSGSVTTGIPLHTANAAVNLHTGVLTFVNLSGNLWVVTGMENVDGVNNVGYQFSGKVTLSGTLDRLRLTTSNGTDVFDAGSVNILYE